MYRVYIERSVLCRVYDVRFTRIEWNQGSRLINRMCTLHFIDPRYIYYGDRYLLLSSLKKFNIECAVYKMLLIGRERLVTSYLTLVTFERVFIYSKINSHSSITGISDRDSAFLVRACFIYSIDENEHTPTHIFAINLSQRILIIIHDI